MSHYEHKVVLKQVTVSNYLQAKLQNNEYEYSEFERAILSLEYEPLDTAERRGVTWPNLLLCGCAHN